MDLLKKGRAISDIESIGVELRLPRELVGEDNRLLFIDIKFSIAAPHILGIFWAPLFPHL